MLRGVLECMLNHAQYYIMYHLGYKSFMQCSADWFLNVRCNRIYTLYLHNAPCFTKHICWAYMYGYMFSNYNTGNILPVLIVGDMVEVKLPLVLQYVYCVVWGKKAVHFPTFQNSYIYKCNCLFFKGCVHISHPIQDNSC